MTERFVSGLIVRRGWEQVMGSAEVSASEDEPPGKKPDGKSDARTTVRRMTLVLPPFLWSWGFAVSWIEGSDAALASSKATAYTISGVVGWAVALWILRPFAAWPSPAMFGGFTFVPIPIMNLLHQTRDPWPFREMLIFGLIISTLNGVMIGLLYRFVFWRTLKKSGFGSSPHPLSDHQVNSPT
jgi:hypothetical protein